MNNDPNAWNHSKEIYFELWSPIKPHHFHSSFSVHLSSCVENKRRIKRKTTKRIRHECFFAYFRSIFVQNYMDYSTSSRGGDFELNRVHQLWLIYCLFKWVLKVHLLLNEISCNSLKKESSLLFLRWINES